MNKEFLNNYRWKWSPSERKLQLDIAGLSESDVLRSCELQDFYDAVDLYRPGSPIESFQMICSEDGNSKLEVSYRLIDFCSMNLVKTGNMHLLDELPETLQNKTICFYQREYFQNRKLCDALIAMSNMTYVSYEEAESKKKTYLKMFGFPIEES